MHPYSYFAAATPAEAVAALSSAPGAALLAGGTTLYDLMKLDVVRPAHVVDINVLGLAGIRADGDELVLGALTRMADAAKDPTLLAEFPALSESLSKAASAQLRNMASLGGNLFQRTRCNYFRHGAPFACNKRAPGSGCAAQEGLNRGHALFGGSTSCIATYPGDFATALVAFDALVDLTGPDGDRVLPIADLHVAPGDTPHIESTLMPGEMVTRIRVPRTPAGTASTYHKIRDRESYAFALVSAAVGLAFDDDGGGVVSDARVALGGVGTTPWRAREAEAALIGRELTDEVAQRAGRAAFAGAVTTSHNAFKVELGANTVADALMVAKGRA